jgi:hypothetical protein
MRSNFEFFSRLRLPRLQLTQLQLIPLRLTPLHLALVILGLLFNSPLNHHAPGLCTAQEPASSATQQSNTATQQPTSSDPFSGPQIGEPLPEFSFLVSFAHPTDSNSEKSNDASPKPLNPVEHAQNNPLLLVFVHDVNRQSVAMTRVLTKYAHSRSKDNLNTAVVFLGDDTSGAQANLKRIQHALTPDVPTGVSPDGREGPGNLGLNRNVQLTILIAKDKKVTANFALVQPSLQADLPKVIRAIIEQVGGQEPKISDLITEPAMARNPANNKPQDTVDADALRALVRPLIQKDATDAQVDEAAISIEQAIAQSPAIKKEIGRIARTIVSGGSLENYGTPRAQEILKIWSEKYGQPSR